MNERVTSFLQSNHSAIMATLKKDGTPHVARVGVGLVDGKLQSSGTKKRVRTAHLRRDPRATLCILSNDNRWAWLGVECRVTIHDGPDAPERNLALYRVLAGEPEDLDEYMQAMRDEQRLIYEFQILNTYGMGL
ncbi:MAG TPA: PPOX class F420-dependent oxidoreductase [Actinomycetota bacterium]|nr:PPOX class F420-dependent oxidoreductase [Actinomycetota bacterium]